MLVLGDAGDFFYYRGLGPSHSLSILAFLWSRGKCGLFSLDVVLAGAPGCIPINWGYLGDVLSLKCSLFYLLNSLKKQMQILTPTVCSQK
jgi:hypothetical protein